MAVPATYDPTLPTDKDHVRFLIGDTDTDDAKLADAEILATLAEEIATGEALKYYGAASCLSVLRTRWASAGEGVLEKEVDDIRVKRGRDQTAEAAIEARMTELRTTGARLLGTSPYEFRVL